MTEDEARHQLWTLLGEHRVLHLGTTGQGGPWCAPLYFAPDAASSELLFVSGPASLHSRHIDEQPEAAASVATDDDDWSRLRGVQMRGMVRKIPREERPVARRTYLQRFPAAEGQIPPEGDPALYAFRILEAKITDNRLGFGHKRRVVLP